MSAGSGEKRRRRLKRGVALILALLVLSILVVVVVQFSYTVKVEARIVQNGADDQQLSVAARGAVAYVSALFRDDRKNNKTPADVDTLADCWNDPHLPDLMKVTCGDVTLQLTIEDLDRRLSLDWFTIDLRQAFMTTALKRLMDKLAIDGDHDKTSKAIRDKVRELAGLQAVADSSGSGPAPAPSPVPSPSPGANGEAPPAKRGILDIESLLDVQVEGVDMHKVLYGDQTAQPPKVGIAGFVTCWCTDTINLNTAPAEVLFAILPAQATPASGGQQTPGQIDDATAGTIVQQIQQHRIDPNYDPSANQNGTGTGTQSAQPSPQPTASGQGQAGASKSWPGKPYENVTDLKEISQLAGIFGGTGTTQQPGQTQPSPSPSPAVGSQLQPGASTFTMKNALGVYSRYYVIVARAQNSSGVQKTVRMVVARNTQDVVTPLLVREDPR